MHEPTILKFDEHELDNVAMSLLVTSTVLQHGVLVQVDTGHNIGAWCPVSTGVTDQVPGPL